MLEGEISNLTYHNSGHVYFSIKDEKSTLSAVIFRGNANRLKFRLEVGQKVILYGSISVYVPRGNYQIICTKIEPSGVGELTLAYEQLKTKLQIKGYFDQRLKKQLPSHIQTLYIVTSNTGAAIEDMKKILAHRYPLAKMILIPSLVQGVGAKEDIARNIFFAESLAKNDSNSVIIVGRGGGSIEDLWAFNEEIVADAIFQATTPIISAVGHESDFVISDFVADLRASTPSNAIELATPNINDLRIYLDTIENDFNKYLKMILQNKIQELNTLKSMFQQQSFHKKFEFAQQNIDSIKNNFKIQMQQIIEFKQNQINLLKQNFTQSHPNKKLQFGYVQVSQNNNIIQIDNTQINDIIDLETTKYQFNCKILDKKEIS